MFEFLKGGCELKLSKTLFKPGETISGTAVFKLKSAVKARKAFVEFFGEQTRSQLVISGSGNRRESYTERIYSFSLELAGEKEYLGEQSFSFEIQIPAQLPFQSQAMPNDIAGGLISAAQFLGALQSPPRWFVRAALDIPMGIDISKKVQISVG